MTGPTEPAVQTTPYRWVVIGVWFMGSASAFMIMSTLGILLPAISLELSLSPAQQGLLASSAFWGNLVLAIPLSWWVSRYSAKLLTTVTLVLGTGFLFLQGWAPVFGVLLLGRLAFGVTAIARQPAQAFLIRQWFQQREIVLVNSISNALFGLVVGGGMAAAPFLLISFGGSWRATLYTFGALFAVLSILWMVLGKERDSAESRRREASVQANVLKGALGYRDLWVGGFGFIGVTLAWSAFLSFYPTMMLEAYDISLRWSGAILALGIFTGGVAGLGFGFAVMATGQGKIILQSLGVLMALSFVGMTMTGDLTVLLVLTFVNGIAWGFWPILYTVPFHLPGIRSREVAVALAFTMMMSSVGTTLGPLVTGFLDQALGDLRLSLAIVSFTSLSLCITGTLLRRETTGGRVQQPEPARQASAD
ncbi:MAG: MFS transporter [Chloroflexi bacterium]|nr:MFS transporter [Chloroflexota bacterium]